MPPKTSLGDHGTPFPEPPASATGPQFPCPHCDQVFDSIQKRGAHKRYAHGAGVRKASAPPSTSRAPGARPSTRFTRSTPSTADPFTAFIQGVTAQMQAQLDFTEQVLTALAQAHADVKPLRLRYIKLRAKYGHLAEDLAREAKEEAA
ncbi:MAG TPA: hypothetical protein VMW48_06515 [Vicinamibacterales bacterium]|nr:hypothetical protein [Vicinamibacterales bacterium]